MEYKSNKQYENPLWRNYMNNVNDDERWMKKVKLNTSITSKSYGTYSEEEFDQMLLSDIQFYKKWGTINII